MPRADAEALNRELRTAARPDRWAQCQTASSVLKTSYRTFVEVDHNGFRYGPPQQVRRRRPSTTAGVSNALVSNSLLLFHRTQARPPRAVRGAGAPTAVLCSAGARRGTRRGQRSTVEGGLSSSQGRHEDSACTDERVALHQALTRILRRTRCSHFPRRAHRRENLHGSRCRMGADLYRAYGPAAS